jgi:hypothetical protein
MKENHIMIWVFGAVMLFIISITGGFIGDFLYKFNSHSNQLHSYILNGNAELALTEFNNVKYFDGLSRNWHLGWLADRYLLNNDKVILYSGAYDYLIGDYVKVASSKSLEGVDDYRAPHMIASAKVRILQARYREEKEPEAKKKLAEELVRDMVDNVNPYFERAVEMSPAFSYPDPNYKDRWNYDISSDEGSAMKTLEAPPPGGRFILGIPQGGREEGEGDDNSPGDRRLNEETKPGAGGSEQYQG